MKTKEEVIQEAYGVDWGKLSDETKDFVLNQEGNVMAYLIKRTEESPFYETVGNGFARPTSLRGIEDNNGWNSMSEPNFEDGEYILFLRYANGVGEPPIFTSTLSDDFEIGYFTHWKRIDINKPPIY